MIAFSLIAGSFEQQLPEFLAFALIVLEDGAAGLFVLLLLTFLTFNLFLKHFTNSVFQVTNLVFYLSRDLVQSSEFV